MSFQLAKPYMGAVAKPRKNSFVLYGLPFDSTTSYRPGSRFAPAAIRDASYGVETYCPVLDKDLEEDIRFGDIGDVELAFGDGERMTKAVLEALETSFPTDRRPFGLGGEHLCSLAPIRHVLRRHPDLCVLQFDAHADLREDYLGVLYSHATVMRRALEDLKPDSLFQVGIRSGTREEWAWMRENRSVFPTDPGAMSEILERIGTRPVYLTVDLDVLDPAVLPGTGTPEPGGASYQELTNCLHALRSLKVVGADVVELAPMLDSTGVSSVVAAKLIRTMLLLFS